MSRPDNVHDWLELGKSALNQGDWFQAVICFQNALNLDPQHPNGWSYLGSSLQKVGRYGEAIVANQNAQKLLKNPKLPLQAPPIDPIEPSSNGNVPEIDLADYAMKQGVVWAQKGEYKLAHESFQRALSLNANTAQVWCYMGVTQAALQQYETAITSFDKALAIDPQDHQALRNRGAILANFFDRPDEALDNFNKALAIQPEDAGAWCNRGILLIKQGQYARAVVDLNRALQIYPNYPEAYLYRGAAKNYLEQYHSALTDFDIVLKQEPMLAEAWVGKGCALAALTRYPEAITHFDRALAIHPHLADGWYHRGDAQFHGKDYSGAITSFSKALECKPTHEKALVRRGDVKSHVYDFANAFTDYDQALSYRSDAIELWFKKAESLRNQQLYTEAIACYDQVLSLTQDSSWEAWRSKALCQQETQGHEMALATLNQGLEKLQVTEANPRDPYGCGRLLHSKGTIQTHAGYHQSEPIPGWLEARQNFLQALEFLTQDQYPEAHLEVLQDLLKVTSHLGDPMEVSQLATQGQDALTQLLARPDRSETEKITLEAKFAGFRHLQVDLLSQDYPTQAIEVIEMQKDRCIGRTLEGWNYVTNAISDDWIRSLLSKNTAIIYWHLSPVALKTFIFKVNQPPYPVDFTEWDSTVSAVTQYHTLETWIQQWNSGYREYCYSQQQSAQTTSWWQNMEFMLFNWLRGILNIPKLCQEHLQDIDNLIFIPHRDLQLIPLHAIFPDRFTITHLPNAQLGLVASKQFDHRSSQLLCIEGHKPAPETTTTSAAIELDSLKILEAEAITELYGRVRSLRLSGENCTRNRVNAALTMKADVLHFAGPCTYNPEAPWQTTLDLTQQDTLSLREICKLDLSRYQLVCLSANDAGLASAALEDDYVGLAHGFLQAGVRGILYSLWLVNDLARTVFMIRFHQLIKEGNLPAQALKQTQYWVKTVTNAELVVWYQSLLMQSSTVNQPYIETLNKAIEIADKARDSAYPYAHPYYWAGFILVGRF
jgi:tetratricopeptide (TPR) repeat protein/CHAT domain-containing protein